jgi:predicted transcriptional regulator
MDKKEYKTVRQGTEKKVGNPTDSLPIISYGKKEKQLLVYLNNLNGRFNIALYSKQFNIKRSSIYDYLNNLSKKGLVDRSQVGNNTITEKGKTLCGVSDGGVGSVRRECRTFEHFSQHNTKYQFILKNRGNYDNYDKDIVKDRLGATKYRKIILPNMAQDIYYLEMGTIIVKKKQVLILIHDISSSDVENNSMQAIIKASEYADKLLNLGLVGDTLILENAHYASMNSQLALFLEKIDNRYFIDLGDGRKFWIDRSDTSSDNIEDETNNEEVRKRLDAHLKAMSNTDNTIEEVNVDLNNLKLIVNDLVKESIYTSKNVETNNEQLGILIKGSQVLTNNMNKMMKNSELVEQIDDKKPNYIG